MARANRYCGPCSWIRGRCLFSLRTIRFRNIDAIKLKSTEHSDFDTVSSQCRAQDVRNGWHVFEKQAILWSEVDGLNAHSISGGAVLFNTILSVIELEWSEGCVRSLGQPLGQCRTQEYGSTTDKILNVLNRGGKAVKSPADMLWKNRASRFYIDPYKTVQ